MKKQVVAKHKQAKETNLINTKNIIVTLVMALIILLVSFCAFAKYVKEVTQEVRLTFREIKCEILPDYSEYITTSQVKVTISTQENLLIEYKIDDGEWQEYTNEIYVTENCIIYGRLTDGTTTYPETQMQVELPFAQITKNGETTYYQSVESAIQASGTEETTIIMLKNSQESVTIQEGQNIILDTNGKTLESAEQNTIINNGTLTIIGAGTINGTGESTILSNGTLTIGIKETDIPNVSITEPIIMGEKYAIQKSTTGTGELNFYDGTIKGKEQSIVGIVNNIQPSYALNIVKDTEYEVATLTSTINYEEYTTDNILVNSYTTLYTALKNSYTGNIIKTVADTTENSESIIEEEKTITLDLNGKTITLDGSNDATEGARIKIYEKATFKLTDTLGGGEITSSNSLMIDTYGTFETLASSQAFSVTYSGSTVDHRLLITRAGSSTTLRTGTFEQTGTVSDGEVVYNFGTVTIDGATISTTSAENSNHGIHNVAENARVIINSGKIETSGTAIYNVNGTGNTTLDPAIKIAGGTISSTESVAVYNMVANSMIYVTDGEIYRTTTGTTPKPTIGTYGNYIMTGGTVKAYAGNGVLILGSGVANVSGGLISKAKNPVTDTWLSGSCFQINGTASATLSGTAVIQNELGNGSNVIYNAGSGTLIIDGATVQDLGASLAGTNEGTGKIIVKSGTVTSASGIVLYNGYTSGTSSEYGTIEIQGGTISTEGSRAIYNQSNYGRIIVSGGTLSATGTSNSYGTIYNNADYAQINISGGTISKPNYPVYNAAGADNSSITITGGTITSTSSYAVYNHGSNSTITVGTSGGTNDDLTITGGIWGDTGDGLTTVYSGTINGTTNIGIFSSGNVTVNGGSISSTSDIPINGQGSTVTVTGGTIININHNTAAIYNETGTTNISGSPVIEGGTKGIHATTGNVIITGGTITSTSGEGVYATTGTITIGDNSNAVRTDTPSITGKLHGVQKTDSSAGSFNFYDGVIIGKNGSGSSCNKEPDDTPPGYSRKISFDSSANIETSILVTTNDNYLVYDGINVVGMYTTLQESFEDVTDTSKQYRISVLNDNITDTSATSPTLAVNMSAILDLQGYEITLSNYIINNGTLDIYSSLNGGIINRNGTVIQNNATGTLTTNKTSNSHSVFIKNTLTTANSASTVINNKGNLTLSTNTTITYKNASTEGTENRYLVLNGSSGITIVDGATLENTIDGSVQDCGISNISSAESARIIVNSGTIETSGYAVLNNGSTKNSIDEPAIKIAGGTISSTEDIAVYNTVANSMIYVTDGEIYRTTSGTTPKSTIETNGNYIMTGGTVKAYAGKGVNILGSGVANVSGGLISKAKNPVTDTWFGHACFQINGTASATLLGTAVVQNELGNTSNVIYNAGSGTLIIDGATIQNLGTATNTGTNASTGKIIVKSGTVTSVGDNVFYNNYTSGTSSKYGTIEIQGGTISTERNSAIYNKSNYGRIIVSGGTLSATGTSGSYGTIYNNADYAQINISGGTISKPNYPVYNAAGADNCEISITGGTITTEGMYSIYVDGENTTVTVGSENSNDNTTPDITGAIYGITENVGDIIVNSGRITGTTGNAIRSYGDIIINGGKFDTDGVYDGSIYPYTIIGLGTSNITINGGEITNDEIETVVLQYSSTSTIEVNGGTITSNSEKKAITTNNGTVIIKGGTVESSGGSGIYAKNLTVGDSSNDVNTESPVIKGTKGVVVTGTFNFYDGVIIGKNGSGSSCNKEPDDTPPGYSRKISFDSSTNTETSILGTTNDNYLVHDGTNMVGMYTTLQQAFAVVTDTSKQYRVSVLENVTDDSTATLTKVDNIANIAILDLNGKTITVETDITTITNNGELTIKDSIGSGMITNTLTTASKNIISNTGTLILNGDNNFIIKGTSTNTLQCIIYNTGTATLSTGTLEQAGTLPSSETSYRYMVNSSGPMIISGATIQTTSNSTTIYDRGVRQVGSETLLISSANITTKGVAVVASSSANTENKPALKVTGGIITSTASYAILNSGSTSGLICIEEGNDSIVSITGETYGIVNYNSERNIIITKGTVTGGTQGICNYANGIITITGGSVTGGDYGIWMSNTSGVNGTLNLGKKDGTVTSSLTAEPSITATNGIGVYVGQGTLNFYDGVIKGKTAAISGGTVIPEDGYSVNTVTSEDYKVATLVAGSTASEASVASIEVKDDEGTENVLYTDNIKEEEIENVQQVETTE